jgi:hypothetical protein
MSTTEHHGSALLLTVDICLLAWACSIIIIAMPWGFIVIDGHVVHDENLVLVEKDSGQVAIIILSLSLILIIMILSQLARRMTMISLLPPTIT